MELVELYRLRSWTIWWCAIVVAVGIILAVSIGHQQVDINGTDVAALNGFPASVLGVVAMFVSMVFATSSGLSLNRENATRALSWTKPASRIAVAIRIIGIDFAALVLVYAVAWIVILAVSAVIHGAYPGFMLEADDRLLPTILVTLGAAFMWYALIEALTAPAPPALRGVVGFLWPAVFVFSQLPDFGGWPGALVAAVNLLNPLAYNTSSITSKAGETSAGGYWNWPLDVRAECVWTLSIALLVIAVAAWIRREA